VDVVLQQEADLRKLQQQFRPVHQQQRLAPWEQPSLLQEQQSSQKLAPWEVAEQRRVQQEQLRLQQEEQQRLQAMDETTIKTPIPECRLYLSLEFIEFIDWRYSQVILVFFPLLRTSALLTFSLVHLPPFPNKYRGTYVFIQCVPGWGG
jgi:hypothetical protein